MRPVTHADSTSFFRMNFSGLKIRKHSLAPLRLASGGISRAVDALTIRRAANRVSACEARHRLSLAETAGKSGRSCDDMVRSQYRETYGGFWNMIQQQRENWGTGGG